jgi:hypothetical protein
VNKEKKSETIFARLEPDQYRKLIEAAGPGESYAPIVRQALSAFLTDQLKLNQKKKGTK